MIKVFIARGNAENNDGRTSPCPPVWIVDEFFGGDLLPQGNRSREMHRLRRMCGDLPCKCYQDGRGFSRDR